MCAVATLKPSFDPWFAVSSGLIRLAAGGLCGSAVVKDQSGAMHPRNVARRLANESVDIVSEFTFTSMYVPNKRDSS